MNPDDQARLLAQLKTDEGCRLYAYADSLGFTTIGYGRLIDRRKGGQISQGEAEYLLGNDVNGTEQELTQYAWFSSQDSVRQAAIVNMAFNLGVAGLLHFPHFLGYLQAKDYANAADQLVGSKWHTEVGVRADRIIALITTGAWP